MAFDETYNEPENVEVLVKSLNPDQPAELYYAHAGDAGADLRTTEEVTLKPFQRALVPTGVAIALPAGYVALVHPRSGLAVKQGVTVLNAPGTIDAGYRGEIKVPLINLDPEHTVTFHPGTASRSWSSSVMSRLGSSKRRRCPDLTVLSVASDPPAWLPEPSMRRHKCQESANAGDTMVFGGIWPCNTRSDTSDIP